MGMQKTPEPPGSGVFCIPLPSVAMTEDSSADAVAVRRDAARIVAAQPVGGSIRAASDRIHVDALRIIAPQAADELRRVSIEERRALRGAQDARARTSPPIAAIASMLFAAVAAGMVSGYRGDLVIDDLDSGALLAMACAVVSFLLAIVSERDRGRRPPADYPHVGATYWWVQGGLVGFALVVTVIRAAGDVSVEVASAVVVLVVVVLGTGALGRGALVRDRRRRALRAALRSTASHRPEPADAGRGNVTERAAEDVLRSLPAVERRRLVSLERHALIELAARDGAPRAALERALGDAGRRITPRPSLFAIPRSAGARD